MRKTVRLVILLLVVAVIYFGYSAWIDSVAIYNIGAVQLGSGTNWNKTLDDLILVAGLSSKENWNTFFATYTHLTPAMIFNGGALPLPDGTITSSALSLGGSTNIAFINALIAEANKNPEVTTPYVLNGFMAANSLLKTLLDPFKMILVGGVFAMFVPLTKQLLFGTVIGMKSYMKNRQSNVLYNYQKTISFTEGLQVKLAEGNFDAVKADYAAYSGLAFKPEFLNIMMDEICSVLIKEGDLTVFAEAAKVVTESIKEMYEKERRRSINGRGDELFFDLKRGYEYCATGSKYSIAYHKALQDKADNNLGWKIYSLEIFKFNFFLVAMFIPAIIISAFVGGLINGLVSNLTGDVRTLAVAATFFVSWVILTIIAHSLMIFRNEQYKNIKNILVKPAIIFYSLYVLTFITISAGIVGVSKVNIVAPGSSAQIWVWFSAVAYLVLSTSLIFYVIATLVDSFKQHKTLSKKLLVDGIILPMIAWIIATVSNFMALYGPDGHSLQSIFSAINGVTLVGFWIYLSISSFLINNLISPNMARELRKAVEADALKNAKAKKSTKSTKAAK
ncbi:putative transmembrane protein [Mesoplasma florum W37]|uniref:Transmembrane protein n=1 Tax=Mesoplasma florum TaxID=2151 RepID=A0AAD0HSG5_MESFO|nr:hypothetical protein [Mesoplasma florum]AGY41585.1 putative transmembrane protein [Mesoplasma florum W37]AVN59796.1 hypothetical protein CG008_02715 [Mesoplasma florum]AVN65923.1 putative transmembrane protein [Mesoplasma florum]